MLNGIIIVYPVRQNVLIRFGGEVIGDDASQARNWCAASGKFVKKFEIVWCEGLVVIEGAEYLCIVFGAIIRY